MKKYYWILAALAILMLTGCMNWGIGAGTIGGSGHREKEIRQVSGVDGVILETSGDLTVKIGSREELVIEADDNLLQYLTSEMNGSMLELGTVPNLGFRVRTPIKYTLTVKSLSRVSLLGSGDIDIEALGSDSMEIKSSGSGILTLDSVVGKSLDLTMLGSGDVKIKSGTVESVALEVSGSGDLRADAFAVGSAASPQDCQITNLGSGRIFLGELNARDLGMNIAGSGSVTIGRGSADFLNLTILGSGDLRAEDVQVSEVTAKLAGSGSATLWVTDSIHATLLGSGDLAYYGSASTSYSSLGSGKVRELGER